MPGRWTSATFDHEAHFRAAWLCLRAAPFREALGRLRRGLKRLAISAGQPQRYHETITVAYARLIHRQMRLLGDPPVGGVPGAVRGLARAGPGRLARPLRRGRARHAGRAQDLRAAPGVEHRAGRALPARVHGIPGGPRTPGRRTAGSVATRRGGWTGAERGRRARVRDRRARRGRRRARRAVVRRRLRLRRRAVPATSALPVCVAVTRRRRVDGAGRAATPSRCARRPGWALYVRLSGGRIRELYASLSEQLRHRAPAPAHALPRRRVRGPRPRRLHRRRQRMARRGRRHPRCARGEDDADA